MAVLNRWLPGPWALDERFRWLGVLPLLAAFTLALWSLGLFLTWRTTFLPYRQPTALLTAGPYRMTRNPLYLSMALTLVAFALAVGTLTCWLVIPLFILCIDRLVIPWEEQALEAHFGDYYSQYRRRVRRWLGLPASASPGSSTPRQRRP